MLFLFQATTLLLFPAAAVWAWRRGGPRALWLLTGLAAAVLFAFALVLASERGGNRLVATHGSTFVAARILQYASLTWVLPLLACAASVRVAAPRVPSQLVYPIAVVSGLLAAAGGVIVAMYSAF